MHRLVIARQLGAVNVDGVDLDIALAEARQHIECIVLDSLTAGNNVVAKVLSNLQVLEDWWHLRKSFVEDGAEDVWKAERQSQIRQEDQAPQVL